LSCFVPGGQLVQLVSLGFDLNLPESHAVQLDAAAAEYEPTGQFVHVEPPEPAW